LFDRKGVLTIQKGTFNQDEFEMELIDAGAEDIELVDETFMVTCAVEDFGKLQKKLEEMKIEVENAELKRIPKETRQLDLESAKKVMAMIDMFEDDDDVQNVYHNMEVSDELLASLD
jgi:transcriptional/translational regulatory protein YebC/TACO1